MKKLPIFVFVFGLILAAVGIFVVPHEGLREGLCLFGAVTTMFGLLSLIFHRFADKHCFVKTSLVSLGLSAAGTLGLYCALTYIGCSMMRSSTMRFPIEEPTSFFLGLFCLFGFVFLLVLYVIFRKKSPSAPGVIIDVLTALWYVIPLAYLYGGLHDIAEDYIHSLGI